MKTEQEAGVWSCSQSLCSRLAQAKVPQIVVDMVGSGRLTTSIRPDGGVRLVGWRCQTSRTDHGAADG